MTSNIESKVEEKQPLVSDSPTTPCKGLKPYNNLDELLYQFYINLDSECLFEMPVEELEKIWETKIFTPVDLDGRLNETCEPSDFMDKPYITERDGFYITALRKGKPGINRFMIQMTSDYAKKHGGFYAYEGNPKLLPKPDSVTLKLSTWYNARKTREIILVTWLKNIGLDRVSYILITNLAT